MSLSSPLESDRVLKAILLPVLVVSEMERLMQGKYWWLGPTTADQRGQNSEVLPVVSLL